MRYSKIYRTEGILAADDGTLISRQGEVTLDETTLMGAFEIDDGPFHVVNGLSVFDRAILLRVPQYRERKRYTVSAGYWILEAAEEDGIIIGIDAVKRDPGIWMTDYLQNTLGLIEAQGHDRRTFDVPDLKGLIEISKPSN